ncbi:MAG: hypothetical protein RBS48_04925 [Ignavibacteriaceae bacterium]|nr:hypothetical protein [Ignavibacteriaceae bacterium]
MKNKKTETDKQVKWLSVPISTDIHHLLKIQAAINRCTLPEMTTKILEEKLHAGQAFNLQESVL